MVNVGPWAVMVTLSHLVDCLARRSLATASASLAEPTLYEVPIDFDRLEGEQAAYDLLRAVAEELADALERDRVQLFVPHERLGGPSVAAEIDTALQDIDSGVSLRLVRVFDVQRCAMRSWFATAGGPIDAVRSDL